MPKVVNRKSNKPNSYSKLAKRRESRASLKTKAVIVMPIIFLAGLVYILRLPSLQITDIAVVGNINTQQEALKSMVKDSIAGNYFFLIPKSNIFVAPVESVSSVILSKFPNIESVYISKNGDRSVEVEIKERKADALWCGGVGDCYIMDRTGFIFERTNKSEYPDFIIFAGSINGNPLKQSFKPEFIGSYFAMKDSFKNKDINLLEVRIISDNEAHAMTNIGKIVFYPNTKDFKSVVDNVSLLERQIRLTFPEKKFEYIDTRFGNKMFYKI